MGYKKARNLFRILIGGVIVLEILALSMFMLKTVCKILAVAGVFCCLAAIVVEIVFCRCEHCRRHLSGRMKDMDECPFCGEKFN